MNALETLRRPETVMVVEHEPLTCQIFAKALREEGYRVVTAATGREALAMASDTNPALIFLDLATPEMEGLATLRKLKREGHKAVAILVTAKATLQGAREAMALDAYDYIAKPLDLELLKSIVREGLEECLSESKESVCAP